MIKSISLRNFQGHENLKLEFTKGLNVLIGPTDAGKSSVIRALRLVLANQPRGGEKVYLTDGATEPMKLTVEDWEGNTIERESRAYKINGNVTLTAFKSDIPESVAEIIRISTVNYQAQIDPHFLILETGGNAAKILNTVTGMEDQMLILAEVKSRMEATRRKHKELNTEKEELIKRIGGLAEVPILLGKLKRIQEKTVQLGELSNSITAITQLIEDLELRIWQSQELSFLDELELNFRKIFARALSNSKLDRSIDSLTMLISSAEQGETILASLSNLTHSDIQCSALQKIAAEQHRLNYQVNALSALIETVESKSQRSQTLDFEIDDYRMRFDQIMNEIGACPLCGAIQKKGGCEHVPNSGSR